MNKLKKIIFIVGPTAVGKSDVALSLAQKIQGEIVSCDSMQIYKEVNIANNKPGEEELSLVHHHLVGDISVEEEFDVAKFNVLARKNIEKIFSRNHMPVVVGGSGLYVNILLDGIFETGQEDKKIRNKLKIQAKKYGNDFLYKKLQECDLKAASKIHQNDVKRIIRALEVCMIEGKPISELQKNRSGLWGENNIIIFGLNKERKFLYEKIEKRVDDMFAKGLVNEIKNLDGLKISRTAFGIIGLKEIRKYLNKECSLEEAKNLMKQNTRRLAKRQLTWFRKDSRIRWILLEKNLLLNDIVDQILSQINKLK